jgi:hypothetical protein
MPCVRHPERTEGSAVAEIAARDADSSLLALLEMTTKFFNRVKGKKKAAIHSRLVRGRIVLGMMPIAL